MHIKRKLITGIFLFVVGIVFFILFVSQESFLNEYINNQLIAISLGIIFFLGFSISGTILVANNAKVIYQEHDEYKINCMARLLIGFGLIIVSIGIIVFASITKNSQVTTVTYYLLCFLLIIFIYYCRKIHKFRKIKKKYSSDLCNINNFYDLAANCHYTGFYKDILFNKLPFLSEISTDFDYKNEIVTFIFKTDHIKLKLLFDNENIVCSVQLPLVVYKCIEDNEELHDLLKENEYYLADLENDDDLGLVFIPQNITKNVGLIAKTVKNKFELAFKLLEFCENYDKNIN